MRTALGFLFLVFAHVIPASAANVKDDISKLLTDQVTAWNAGDIDTFMKAYWDSDQLTFTSGGKVRRGFKSTLEAYKTTYKAGNMGTLDFSDLEFTDLGKSASLVMGRWKLTERDEPKGGIFTLILRKVDGKWKIIHDHTSADPPPPAAPATKKP